MAHHKIFKHQIMRNIEVYVNDLLIKFTKHPNHIKDLRKSFDVLRQYQIKLNPQKRVFWSEIWKISWIHGYTSRDRSQTRKNSIY